MIVQHGMIIRVSRRCNEFNVSISKVKDVTVFAWFERIRPDAVTFRVEAGRVVIQEHVLIHLICERLKGNAGGSLHADDRIIRGINLIKSPVSACVIEVTVAVHDLKRFGAELLHKRSDAEDSHSCVKEERLLITEDEKRVHLLQMLGLADCDNISGQFIAFEPVMAVDGFYMFVLRVVFTRLGCFPFHVLIPGDPP